MHHRNAHITILHMIDSLKSCMAEIEGDQKAKPPRKPNIKSKLQFFASASALAQARLALALTLVNVA
jgi:hypothetical protein